MTRSYTSRTATRSATALEIAVLVAVAAAILVAAALPAIRRSSVAPRTFSSVRVRSGESLWRLAETHPVRGFTTQELVEVIRAENAISDTLVAGDVVRLPVAEFNDAAVCQR